MAYGIKLHCWGEWACFTRPEMKVERVSYDVMTPSAARGVVESIYWKPEIRWHIDRITVLKPIKFSSVRRNEVKEKIGAGTVAKAMKDGEGRLAFYVDEGDNRQQRATLMLRDVGYVIEAHIESSAARTTSPSISTNSIGVRARAVAIRGLILGAASSRRTLLYSKRIAPCLRSTPA
jgi:CRISPR-associated protein Cas5d